MRGRWPVLVRQGRLGSPVFGHTHSRTGLHPTLQRPNTGIDLFLGPSSAGRSSDVYAEQEHQDSGGEALFGCAGSLILPASDAGDAAVVAEGVDTAAVASRWAAICQGREGCHREKPPGEPTREKHCGDT